MRRGALSLAVAALVIVSWSVSQSWAAIADTITVGQAANGSCRTLDRGDMLLVRLASNPSTGYAWRIRTVSRRIVRLVGRAYIPPRSGKPLGAPGTAVLRFRAAAVGKTVLRLAYVRSWESGVAPERTFTLRVAVT